MEFEEMVRFAVENGASDIHLASNNLPSYRKNGKIMNYKGTEILFKLISMSLCLCACPPKFRLLCLFLVAHRPLTFPFRGGAGTLAG